jgi:asparaginyl-tRNA synthetase
MGLIDRLKFVLENPFERITYTDAIEILLRSKPHQKKQFQFPVEWGIDLQSEHERYLVEKHFKKPVIVTGYPGKIKAFYMRTNAPATSATATRAPPWPPWTCSSPASARSSAAASAKNAWMCWKRA